MSDMSDELLDLSATVWTLAEPRAPRPLTSGTNNDVYLLETQVGNFVLRMYNNHADAGRLRFEHAVLTRLQTARLPFGLPIPIPTTSGDLYLHIVHSAGESLATLTPYIPGNHPNRSDLAQARAGGEALSLLDVALAAFPTHDVVGAISWRSYGDLAHCHPLVPDPRAALQELPVASPVRDRLVGAFDQLTARIPALYASLPQQLVHEDYAPDNLLMHGTIVTGVLDFEFCSRDLRVMDLTVALSWWPVARFGTGDEWPIIQAVTDGYARHITLTTDEIQAIPTLYQLRAYTSLIHRIGRYRQGLSPLPAVIARADAAIEREDWLRTNATNLMATVSRCIDTER